AGGEPARIIRFPSRVHDLCWSADGAALFLVSELGGAHYDLWRVPVDDPERGVRRITSGEADEKGPPGSADGPRLVYTDNHAGPTALVAHDLSARIDSTLPVRALDFGRPTATLRLRAIDKSTGRPVTARLSLRDGEGKFYAPPGALYRVLDD